LGGGDLGGARNPIGSRHGGSGWSRPSDSSLVGLALEISKMTFKRRANIAGCPAELTQHFPEVSRQFRQLFGSENDQSHHKNDDQMRDTQHRGFVERPLPGRF